MSQMIEYDAAYVASKLKQWSEKSNRPIDELKNSFQDILAKTEGRSDAIKYKKALNILKRTFESSMNSSAISYDVILIGMASPYDAVRKRRADLEERYLKSPSECIAEGSVVLGSDNTYTLMDTQKLFRSGKDNFNYGKPIAQHSWTATVYAVAKKPDEDQKWLPATIVLRDELAMSKLPFFTQMSVRLNGTFSSEQSRYILNASKGATSFTSLGKDVSVNDLTTIVDEVYGGKFVMPQNLRTNLEETKADPSRYIVTEATLNRHYKNQKPDGLSTIELSDEGLDIGEKITGFVDSSISSMLDNLEDGETVSVIGRTSLIKEKDENRQETGEMILGMNVYSVFTRPE